MDKTLYKLSDGADGIGSIRRETKPVSGVSIPLKINPPPK